MEGGLKAWRAGWRRSFASRGSAAARPCPRPCPCSRPAAPPLQVGFAASFASKLADTTSSEIGKAYGQTTYLITNLQRVQRGTEGAVSLEGTAAGVAAAAGVAGMAFALGQVRGGSANGREAAAQHQALVAPATLEQRCATARQRLGFAPSMRLPSC